MEPDIPPVVKSNYLLRISLALLTISLISIIVFAAYQYFLLKYPNNQTLPVATITPTPASDWQTYTNTKYDFSFQYPNNWEVKPSEKGIYISSNAARGDMPEGGMGMSVETTNLKLTDFVHRFDSKEYVHPTSADPSHFQTYDQLNTQERITLDGIPATHLVVTTEIGLDVDYLFFNHNQQNFVIGYADYDPFHKQILSTFKFLEPNPTPTSTTINLQSTAGWQTAENSTFSIRYPADKFTVSSSDKYIQLTKLGQTNPGPDFLLYPDITGSSQNWFLDHYSYYSSEVTFKSKILGNITALEATIKSTPNYVQHIIVTNGTNLIDLVTQDTDIKLMETIVSTLSFK
jgi:hypothetical protein